MNGQEIITELKAELPEEGESPQPLIVQSDELECLIELAEKGLKAEELRNADWYPIPDKEKWDERDTLRRIGWDDALSTVLINEK